jgi:hypothetical protein
MLPGGCRACLESDDCRTSSGRYSVSFLRTTGCWLITDGAHYDNLGLVELVRHRCRTIFCIDASGDTPPFPQTLNQAIALAWEELGVKISLEDQLDLVPGSAEPLAPEDL